jgi:MOSC domain-containing protein YiiM
MRVVSVNVGLPRTVTWRGQPITTAIFKEPVAGRVALRGRNLAGDRQADARVHGGPDKAVYAYPAEHYAYWRAELGLEALAWGAFGENLTVAGLDEAVHVGDRLRVGTAELRVTQPRLPCLKLGARFGRADMPKRFAASRRTGFYLAVVREGEIGAGDPITLIAREPASVSLAEVTRLYLAHDAAPDALRRAAAVEALPVGWRQHFLKELAAHEA